jgi:hypothetical protein
MPHVPEERGFQVECRLGVASTREAYFSDSFGRIYPNTPNDPYLALTLDGCSTKYFSASDLRTAAHAHTHPYFVDYPEMNQNWCHGYNDYPHPGDPPLPVWNDINLDFSEGDFSFFLGHQNIPLYVKQPRPNENTLIRARRFSDSIVTFWSFL